MRKLLCLFALSAFIHFAQAQCLVSSIVINTGYDPLTGIAIPGGLDGGTPVPDPKWIVTAYTPGVVTAAGLGGYTMVPIGGSADVMAPWTGWISNPPGNPGRWITCMNAVGYTTDGTGPTGTPYNMMLTRPFRTCSDDSIKLDFYIANDNYISAIDVDGIFTTFSQPAGSTVSNYTSFTHFTQTLFLPGGTHNIHVFSHNYNITTVAGNPTGVDIYGTVSSAASLNNVVAENNTSCATYVCSANCDSIAVPDSLIACAGTDIVLPATIFGSDSVISVTWSPATGLSSTTGLSPTLTVGTSRYYTVTERSLFPYNLVVNGDFEAGNTGFTSSYGYVSGPGSLFPESVYAISTDPFMEHSGAVSFHDHTTGSGKMMAINGASSPISVWCQTISVTPNTDYNFSAWVANWSTADVGPGAPILQFQINGVLIGAPFNVISPPGTWVNFFTTWNSGVSTTATICIYDAVTVLGGNDFSLDDIWFQPICVSKDSVYVTARTPDTTTTTHDTMLCAASAPLTLRGRPSYTWSWSTGASSSSINVIATGAYWVHNISLCSDIIDTFHVNFVPEPVVNLGVDTAFCIGNTLTLSSTQPPGSVYLWSTGSTGTSISVSTSGAYWLRVDNGFCTTTDTIHVTISPPPIVDLGPDQANCTGAPVTLGSSITYTSPAYLWSTGATSSTISVPTSGTYWLDVTVAGCMASDTVNVTIIFDTARLQTPDTAICRNRSIAVVVSASPLATFSWRPTAGVPSPTLPNPVITPDTSAWYKVTISYPGCPDIYDSLYIDVQPTPVVFIAGRRTVCEFDTIHLHAVVSSNWYTHYSYQWVPSALLDDATMPDVVFAAGANSKYILTVTTPAGCSGQDSVDILVYPGNFASLNASFDVCPHDSVQLVPNGGISYTWHPGLYLTDSTSAAPWVHAITSQAYLAVAKSSFGCLDTVYANVVVHPAARIYLGDSVSLYPGESYHITPQTNCTYFTWSPAAGLDYWRIADPTAAPQVSTEYFVTAQTEWGCRIKDSINVYVNNKPLLTLPNAFSPGSGPNNKFYVLKRGEAKLHYFRIFDRWGNKIFETANIDEGWDGTYKGKMQPYDVYVYQVEAETSSGEMVHKTGNVTLIK